MLRSIFFALYQVFLQSIIFSQRLMKSKLIALALALTITLIVIYQQQHKVLSEYEAWKLQFGIAIDSAYEDIYREKVFFQNQATMNAHNAKKDKTYQMGLNQFSALTSEEFSQNYLQEIKHTAVTNHIEAETATKVGDIDWVAEGYVTPIKNQGQCGGVIYFNPVQACQGLYRKSTGKLEVLSVQQVIDCSKSYGNRGCIGGFLDSSWKYIKDHGVSLQSEYPSTFLDQTCKKINGTFKISGYTSLAECTQLANALASLPVGVAVDATNWSPYKTGIFSNCKTTLNHAVLLVGMTIEYWKVKNIWGVNWGEQGFMRLAKGNTCGICNIATYPNK